MRAHLHAWRGERSWPRSLADWMRCWSFGFVPLVWAIGLQVEWWTPDASRVPFGVALFVTWVLHSQRAREKDREQDRELDELEREHEALWARHRGAQ